jgi:hypothetical protein
MVQREADCGELAGGLVGAIGVARSLVFYSNHGMSLREIAGIMPDNIQQRFIILELEETRQVARTQAEYGNLFYERLRQEL